MSTDTQTNISGSVFDDNGNGADLDLDATDVLTVTDVNNSVSSVGFDVSGSNGGIFVINDDGSYTFEPSGDFDNLGAGQTATTSVTYDIDDGNGGRDQATVTVTVTGLTASNNPPNAVDDFIDGGEDDVVTANVLDDNGAGPDNDPDANDILTVFEVDGMSTGVSSAVAGDNGGLFTIDSNGDLSFDPNGEFEALASGQDDTTSVTYSISDGNGGMDTATATVVVSGANDAPEAQDDDFSTDEDTGITGDAFADNGNGVDFDVDGGFGVTSVDGAGGNVGDPVTGSGGGLFTVNMDGTFSFDPNGEFENLAMGETATTRISYTIEDSGDDASTAEVTVVINGINDAPEAQDDLVATTSDAIVTGSVFADNGNGPDTDPEDDDIMVDLVGGQLLDPQANSAITDGNNGGVFTINADGTFSFDPSGDFDNLANGVSADTSVDYRITDGVLTDTATFTVTVTNNINRPPVAVDDEFTTNEASDTGGNVFADNGNGADNDPENDPFTVATVDGTAANVGMQIAGSDGGVFTIASDGNLDFDPSGEFEALAVGQSATTSISYTIASANGAESNTATVTVTINGVNDAPVARADEFSVDEGGVFDGNVLADNGNGADEDIDGDALNVSRVNDVANNVGATVAGSDGGSFVIASDGSLSFDTNGDFDGLGDGQSATTSVTYDISDGNGGSDTATVTVTVNGVNDAPVARADEFSVNEGGMFDGNVLADNGNGADEDIDGDTLSVSRVNDVANNVGATVAGSDGGSFVIASDGSLSFDTNGDFNGLAAGQTATTGVTYDISDGNGGTDTETVTVTVNGVNDAPIASDDAFLSSEDSGFDDNVITGLNPFDQDIDPDGDPLTVSAINGVAGNVGNAITGSNGGLFTVNASGEFVFDPNGDFEALAVTEITSTRHFIHY